MKLKDVLPPAVMGSLGTGFMLIILTAYAAASLQSGVQVDVDATTILMLILAALAFTGGGFIAAYLAGKKAKDRVDRALSASTLSGIITALGVSVLFFAYMLVAGTSIGLVALNTTEMLITLGVSGLFLTSLGGILFAKMSGKGGGSVIGSSLKRAWKAYARAPASLVLPFGFVLLMLGLRDAVGGIAAPEELVLAASAVAGLLMFLLTAFAVTSIVLAVKKKWGLQELLRQSVKKSKPVFLAALAGMVPLAAGALAVGAALVGLGDAAAAVAALLPLLALLAIAYLVAISLLPQSILLSKKKVLEAFANSYRTVKANLALFIGLFGVIVVSTTCIEVSLMIVEGVVAVASGAGVALLMEWVATSINVVIPMACLTAFYLEVKK
ncbi:MAG: hypothetical protein KAW41_03575 [Candidatus Diapherotrites archaeon]|nr:hypothetical protein [Candidatus Diapherotrites archaeon]